MSGKSRQHAACCSLKTAWCGPGRSILGHLLSVQCCHAKTVLFCVLAALMASTWQLRQQRVMKTSIPVNCPWGSVRSCHVVAVHFRLPIAGPVLSLHVSAPLPVPHWPPATGPTSVQSRELPSQWPAVGLSTFQSWGPHSLSAAFCSPVSSSLHVHMPSPKLLL